MNDEYEVLEILCLGVIAISLFAAAILLGRIASSAEGIEREIRTMRLDGK